MFLILEPRRGTDEVGLNQVLVPGGAITQGRTPEFHHCRTVFGVESQLNVLHRRRIRLQSKRSRGTGNAARKLEVPVAPQNSTRHSATPSADENSASEIAVAMPPLFGVRGQRSMVPVP